MKKFRTILTGILASLVLMSSISHSVSFHLCGGEVQSMAIFGHAQPCEEHTRGCDHDSGTSSKESVGHKGCCEDATVAVDSEKYSTKVSETVTAKPLSDVLPLIAGPVENFKPFVALAHVRFFNYRPPLIERDITILVQTFLI